MPSSSFHLRWNNHLQNIQSLFEALYTEQALVDVTISCSDGVLKGHKLVLCACSPYFEQVLRENPCEHPIVILRGVSVRVMRLLLEYMYKGAVDVAEQELETMLDTATDLMVKGLVKSAEGSEGSEQRSHRSISPRPECPPQPPLQPQPQLQLQSQPVDQEHFSQHESQPEDDIVHMDDSLNVHQSQEEEEYGNEEGEYSNYNIHEILSEADWEQGEDDMTAGTVTAATKDDAPSWTCHICSRTFLNKTSHQRHMMTHTGVKPHQCTFCSQSFLRLSHLQRHVRVHTGERPYACAKCPKQFARSDKLRQHYIINHDTHNTLRMPRGRGRPPKHFSPSSPMLNSPYSVSINPIPMNSV